MIDEEILRLHIVEEREKAERSMAILITPPLHGVIIRRYGRASPQGESQCIYQNEGFATLNFIRWQWYFRYLGAIEQIKTPRQAIEVFFYQYPHVGLGNRNRKTSVMLHITIADILRAERDRRHKAYPELIAQGTLSREEANRRWCAFCTLLPRAGVATDLPPRYFVPFADALAEYERWLPDLPIPAQVVVEHWLKQMQAPLRPPAPPAPAKTQPTLF